MLNTTKSKKKQHKTNDLEFSRMLKTASTAIKSLPSKQHLLKKRNSQKKSRSVKRQSQNPESIQQTSRVNGLVISQKALLQSKKKYKKYLQKLNSYYAQLQEGLKLTKKRAEKRLLEIHRKNEQQIARQIDSIGRVTTRMVSSFSKEATRCIQKLHYPKLSNKTPKIIKIFQVSLNIFEQPDKELGISETNPLDSLGQEESPYASPFKCLAP